MNIVSQKRTFNVEREPINVTSLSRPNPSWSYTDPSGHVHQFDPFGGYDPSKSYNLPSLVYVVDIEGTDDEPPIGHHECRWCGAHVQPSYIPDSISQYIVGEAKYRINGKRVTREAFVAGLLEDGLLTTDQALEWLLKS